MANTHVNLGSNGTSNYVIATYWEVTSSTSGTITAPQGSQILLDTFQDLEDAIVSKTVGGKPDFNAALTSGNARISSTFDTSGSYVLSGTPASFPVAILYRVIIPESLVDYQFGNVVVEDVERPGGSGAGTVTGGQNVGSGTGIFKDLNGGDLRFKSLVGNGVNISSDTDQITLSINSYMPGGW